MSRTARCLAAAVLASAAAMFVGAARAGADAPSQQGWWTSTNRAVGFGVPTAPAPPDVPPGGLLVEGGQPSPTAFAAVVYDIPPGATVGKLTLTVATEGGQPDATPATTLKLCPLSSPGLNPEQGGPMQDAPAYSAEGCVSAGASPNRRSYTFTVASMVADGALAVAILPATPTDRVALVKPGADSLPVQSGSTGASTGFGGSGPIASGSPQSGAGSPGVGPPTAPGAGGSSPVAAGPSNPVLAGAAPAPAPALANPRVSGTAASSPPTGPIPAARGTANQPSFASTSVNPPGAKPWAVGLLIGVAMLGSAVWLSAGRAARRAALGGGVDPA